MKRSLARLLTSMSKINKPTDIRTEIYVYFTKRFISYRKYILQIMQPSHYRCMQLQCRFAVFSEAPSIYIYMCVYNMYYDREPCLAFQTRTDRDGPVVNHNWLNNMDFQIRVMFFVVNFFTKYKIFLFVLLLVQVKLRNSYILYI